MASVVIDCHATRLWNTVGRFAGFDTFIPGPDAYRNDRHRCGALRTKFFRDGNRVVEQLNSWDEHAMHMTWTTIYNTLGVARLWAAIKVDALGEHCSRVTWTIIAEPLDAAQVGFEQFVPGVRRWRPGECSPLAG